jgi:hypothetical protein
MARTFKMPENLNIHFTFANGKYTIKDILFRCVGILVGLPAGLLINTFTNNQVWAIIVGLMCFGFGWFIGGKKVFNKTIPLFTAIFWHNKNKKKTKLLYNKRTVE